MPGPRSLTGRSFLARRRGPDLARPWNREGSTAVIAGLFAPAGGRTGAAAPPLRRGSREPPRRGNRPGWRATRASGQVPSAPNGGACPAGGFPLVAAEAHGRGVGPDPDAPGGHCRCRSWSGAARGPSSTPVADGREATPNGRVWP